MSRLLSMIAVVCGIFISGNAVGQKIDWMHDVEAAQKLAIEQDKLVLLHFSAEWCRPCKQLETFVFSSPLVAKAVSEKVVPVHVDTDTHPELVKQFSIEEIPADVVVTTKGRVVSKRKSPKDISNYVRMVKSLPMAGQANGLQNVEIAQKIDQVISANKKELFNPGKRDIASKKPEHQRPAPSGESMELVGKTSTTRQVVHESNSFVPRNGAGNNETAKAKRPAPKPQRVINDKFFVEKTTIAGQPGSMPQTGESNSFNPSPSRSMQMNSNQVASRQVASAKINNPFQAETKAKTASSSETAARIMTPDFSKERKMAVRKMDAGPAQVASNQIQQSTANRQAPIAKISPEINMNAEATIQKNKIAAKRSQAKIAQTVAPEFALGGRCPVTLLQDGKWMKGDSKFGCVHRGRVYIFGDEAKLELFKSSPDKFSPVLAGYDPVEFHESGTLVDGQEENGVFMGKAPEQKIVLFSSKETRKLFQSDPQKYMSTIRTAVRRSEQQKVR